MARIVGMNEMADNLEHLCYQNLDLDMFNNVQEALFQTKPKRCEYQSIWEKNLTQLLQQHQIAGRIKKKNNNIELLRHFVKNDINLQELTHSHAFEIILQSIADVTDWQKSCGKISRFCIMKIISAVPFPVEINR